MLALGLPAAVLCPCPAQVLFRAPNPAAVGCVMAFAAAAAVLAAARAATAAAAAAAAAAALC